MAVAIYPLQLSPSALGLNYTSEVIQAVGGVAPYTFQVTGDLPPGIFANIVIPNQLTLAGRPVIADQYASSGGVTPILQSPAFVPVLVNPSTFTVTVTDSTPVTPLTASISYTLPVGVYNEDEAISAYEMLKANYSSDWYIVMGDMGTRNIKIGDIGNAGFGGIRLVINAYLNSQTAGEVKRMRYYIRQFDRYKLVVQEQKDGSVEGITGINLSFQQKLCKILELSKSCLPAYTRAEVEARQAHKGGSDFTGSITAGPGGTGSAGSVRLSR